MVALPTTPPGNWFIQRGDPYISHQRPRHQWARCRRTVVSGCATDYPAAYISHKHLIVSGHVWSTLPGMGEGQRSQYQMGATPLIVVIQVDTGAIDPPQTTPDLID